MLCLLLDGQVWHGVAGPTPPLNTPPYNTQQHTHNNARTHAKVGNKIYTTTRNNTVLH